MTQKYERHPLSAIYGDMSPEEYLQMQDSIGNEGVHEPAVLFEGKILDGWQRYSTAEGLRMHCPVREFGTHAEDGPATFESALAYVAWRHTGRNLTQGQIAAIAVKRDLLRVRSAPGAEPKSAETIAKEEGVSTRTVEQARAVIRDGIKPVNDAMAAGDISAKRAADIVKLPKREQSKALREPPKPRPAWRPVGTAPLPRPVVGPSQQAYEDLAEKHSALVDHVEELETRLAVQFMDGTDEERLAASALIADQASRIKTLEAELSAVKGSRNHYMEEANELKKQCGIYRSQLAKLSK